MFGPSRKEQEEVGLGRDGIVDVLSPKKPTRFDTAPETPCLRSERGNAGKL